MHIVFHFSIYLVQIIFFECFLMAHALLRLAFSLPDKDFSHLCFVSWLSERGVLIVLIRLVYIYPTIWWRKGAPSDDGRGFPSANFLYSELGQHMVLTQTLTQTTPGADGSIGVERSGKHPLP